MKKEKQRVKDYQNYMQYMQIHTHLLIEGEISERYALKPEERAQGKTAPYALKIKKISLLGTIAEDYITCFTINMDSSRVTPELRKSLSRTLSSSRGRIPLHINLNDEESGYRVEFVSKKYSVAVNTDMVEELKRLGVSYKIGRKQRSGSSS